LFVITTHRSESLTNYISYPASKTTATFGLNSGGRFIVGQEKSDSSPMSQWSTGFDPEWPFVCTATGQKKPHSQEGGKERGKFSVPL